MEKLKNLISDLTHNENIVRVFVILIVTLIVLLFTYYLKKIVSNRVSDLDNKYRSRKAINVLGYILFTAAILFVYSNKLGNVGIAMGLAGAGIAFALQEVIASVAGWISIMFSNSVKVGQRVKIGEITGDIIDIAVLKTTIMEIGGWINGDNYNGRITTIANSFVFKQPIQNYSADYPFLWDEITVPIRTESDFKLAREIFIQVAEKVCGDFTNNSELIWKKMKDKYRIEEAEVKPTVTLSFDENWITFTIRYIVDYRKRRSTKDNIFTLLLEEINKQDSIFIATSTMEVSNVQYSKNDK